MRQTAGGGEVTECKAKIIYAKQALRAVPTEQIPALELKHQAEKAADDAQYDCECGGHRVNKKPLFCPSCKSLKLQYKARYMT